ncbi:MAG TPA: TolC family protein [Candidatus Kapabacteria bacterium]|nr:TolC family protein [Candidatus Kapabacteria bacterium]
MKNKILCLIGLLLFFNNANAQLTLKEAINRSISTNKGIEAAKKNVEAKTNNVQSAYGRYLPNINFDITYNYIDRDIVIDLSPIRSAMISLQANNQVGFSNLEALLKTGAPLTAEQQQAIKQGATEKLNNSIPEFEKTLKERAFPKATFTINQPIFTGGKISAGVDASRAQKELELKKLDAETAEIVSQVINAYINVLIAEENLQVRYDALKTIEKHNERAQGMLKQGLIAPHDKLRADVALSEAKRNVFEAEEKLKIAKIALSSLLNNNEISQLAEKIQYKTVEQNAEYFIEIAKNNNPLLEQIRYGAKALDAKAKAEMANYFPTIYGFGMYDVFDHYRSAIDPKWAVGIGASFTIFNGMRRTNDYQAAKAESESYNALAAEIERKIELGVRNYYMEMKLAENSYLMLEDAIQQATENLRLNEKRYETGLGTSIEVLDAELSLEAIKLNRNNALKDDYSNLVQICKIINNNDYFLNIWEKNN